MLVVACVAFEWGSAMFNDIVAAVWLCFLFTDIWLRCGISLVKFTQSGEMVRFV